MESGLWGKKPGAGGGRVPRQWARTAVAGKGASVPPQAAGTLRTHCVSCSTGLACVNLQCGGRVRGRGPADSRGGLCSQQASASGWCPVPESCLWWLVLLPVTETRVAGWGHSWVTVAFFFVAHRTPPHGGDTGLCGAGLHPPLSGRGAFSAQLRSPRFPGRFCVTLVRGTGPESKNGCKGPPPSLGVAVPT